MRDYIAEVDETITNQGNVNHLYTYFDIDDLNRVSAHRTKYYDAVAGAWKWRKRAHSE